MPVSSFQIINEILSTEGLRPASDSNSLKIKTLINEYSIGIYNGFQCVGVPRTNYITFKKHYLACLDEDVISAKIVECLKQMTSRPIFFGISISY